MKYLRSASQRSYAVAGANNVVMTIPSRRSQEYLIVSDADYNAIVAAPTIKQLIDHGSIYVYNDEPADYANSPANLQASRAELQKQLTAAQKEIESLKSQSDAEAIREEALAEIQKRDQALEAAQKEIEALKAQLEG